MICNVCGHDRWACIRTYKGPDKYEKCVGINGPAPMRSWWRCAACGLYKCRHSYDPERLQSIYINGYRNEEFRKESLEDTFKKITQLPHDESENAYRVRWLLDRTDRCNLLDIGSGIGIFPYVMKWHGYDVVCIEPNKDSWKFMIDKLGLYCLQGFFGDALYSGWIQPEPELVSVIHVLEHLEDPENFLLDIKKVIKPNGRVYVEVPDAVEFSYLDKDNDEFNSCHLYFFTASSLVRLLESIGFHVTDLHRVRTKERDLSRIMVLANA